MFREFRLGKELIDADQLARKYRSVQSGAEVTFTGVVRGDRNGREVEFLEFESYEGMAIRELDLIASEIESRWPVDAVALHHRIGRVRPGETAVVAIVVSAHRKEAFEACAFLMDRLKQSVPIWKKECYSDGSEWVTLTP